MAQGRVATAYARPTHGEAGNSAERFIRACSVHAFELPRVSWNDLSRRHMSSRISDYTRGQRQGTSGGEFPGRSIGGRDAVLRRRDHTRHETESEKPDLLVVTVMSSAARRSLDGGG